MKKVQITEAIAWQCPKCGKRNGQRLTPSELSEEERRDLAEQIFGTESWQPIPEELNQISLTRVPRRVRCRGCRKRFRVQLP